MKEKGNYIIEKYSKELKIEDLLENINPETFEKATHICDLSDIIIKYNKWKELMPRITPFYAVKCNDHPVILKTLSLLGTGFDCASKPEIDRVLSIGVGPEKIIYANPTKPLSHLIHARENDINVMTFDSDFEIYKIRKYFPKAELVIRIRYDAKQAYFPLGKKFGCDPKTEAPKLIHLAKTLGLKIIGVSFHVGSGCMELASFGRAIAAARSVFDYGKSIGYNFELLDIGGGFLGEKGTSLIEVSDIINKALDKYFPCKDIKIISEPGAYFVTSASTVICKIHSKREIRNFDTNKIENIMYYINDGVFGSFSCVLFNCSPIIPRFFPNHDGELYESTIWGPTCDAYDQVFSNIMLPELDIGDFFIFENMGAYTICLASQFNGYPIPAEQFYINEKDDFIKEGI